MNNKNSLKKQIFYNINYTYAYLCGALFALGIFQFKTFHIDKNDIINIVAGLLIFYGANIGGSILRSIYKKKTK